LVAIVPTVAVKPAEVAPAATVTDDGADSSVLFEASATVLPPDAAAALNVAVQVVEPFDAKLPTLHSNDVTVASGAGAVSAIEADCELPFSVAVTLAL
jgi:hypothetical protein